jgi:hypothetical protein
MFVSNVNVKNKYASNQGHVSTISSVTSNNGIIVDYGHVDLKGNDLNIGPNRSHQSRVSEDTGHIRELQNDIQHSQLQNIPIVEKNGPNYDVLSGHHRIFACKNLNWAEMPVCVVSFSNDFDRQRFMQRDQLHRPAKRHNVKDLLSFLKKMDSLGAFRSCASTEAVKQSAIAELTPLCSKPTVTKVVEQFMASRNSNLTVRQLQKNDVSLWANSVWSISSYGKKVKFKSGMVHPAQSNVILIASVPTAADKAIYNVMKKVARDRQTRQIEIAVYGQSADPKGLNNERATAISEYTNHNRMFGSVALIEKIAILPQVHQPGRVPEVLKTLTWNPSQGKFI